MIRRGIRRIPRVVFNRWRSLTRKIVGYPFVRKAEKTTSRDGRKKALLVYLVDPFLLKENDPGFLAHQNFRQSRQIVAALAREGYSIDVSDVRATKLRTSDAYDLVISHRVDLNPDLPGLKNAAKVYLSTGIHHRLHNENVLKRHRSLEARGRIPVHHFPEKEDKMPFLNAADAIVGFGNSTTVGTWQETAKVPIFPFNNYGFDSESSPPEQKDFARARRHFLFFASRDQVAKGLDLLLEIFPAHADLHLYVCSAFRHEPSFVRTYKRELYSKANIHPIGLVEVGGKEFRDLLTRCAFVVLPSCSDAQPGSVIQCMHIGLIPLVTNECGIDFIVLFLLF